MLGMIQQSKRSVSVSTFLMLLFSDLMVDCWRLWCQHNMHFFENMKGCQLVYEDGHYS